MIKNSLFFISIFGTLTNLYPALATLSGFEFSEITLLFLLLNIIILFISYKEFKVLIKKKIYYNFFFFFLFIPLLISVVTKETNLNFLLINIYYLSITLTSSILFQAKYKNLLALILFSALIFNLVTAILSMVYPELFLIMAEAFDKSIYAGGRGFGLFLQPNMLGHSAVLIFVFSIYVFFNNRKLYSWVLSLSMVTIFLSGSRSSIIIFFTAIFVHYLIYLIKIKQKKFSYKKYSFFLLFLFFIFITFSGIKISEISFLKNLKDRMVSSLSTETFSKDPSQLEREYKRTAYYERIMKKPFLGYGIGTQFIHKKKGILKGAAHNTHLEIIYQGGILYYLFFIFFGINLLIHSIKLKKYNEFLWSYCLILICVCFLFSFITSNLLQLRVLFVAFGPMLIFNKTIQIKLNE